MLTNENPNASIKLDEDKSPTNGRPPIPKQVSIGQKHKDVINRYYKLKENNNLSGKKQPEILLNNNVRASKNSLETETQRTL